MRFPPACRAALWLLCLAAPAAAHEYWLAPDHYVGAARDTLVVRAYVGTGFRGELKPYASPRTRRLELRTARVIDLRTLALNGEDDYARFITPDAGGAIVSYESDFATIQLGAPEFDAYLKLEGLDGPREARAKLGALAGPGRERYARCCRTWIAGQDAARATQAVGMTLELTPARDPVAGGTVPFAVHLRGAPLAGALVRMWRRPLAEGSRPFVATSRDSLGPVWEGRTAKDGNVQVPIREGGEYMVSCVHMEPSELPAQADWQSFWANYTFARPGGRR